MLGEMVCPGGVRNRRLSFEEDPVIPLSPDGGRGHKRHAGVWERTAKTSVQSYNGNT